MVAFLGGLPRRLGTTVAPTAFVCGGSACFADFFILAVATLASELDSVAKRCSVVAPRVLFFDSVRINVALDCSQLAAYSLRLVVDEAGVSE